MLLDADVVAMDELNEHEHEHEHEHEIDTSIMNLGLLPPSSAVRRPLRVRPRLQSPVSSFQPPALPIFPTHTANSAICYEKVEKVESVASFSPSSMWLCASKLFTCPTVTSPGADPPPIPQCLRPRPSIATTTTSQNHAQMTLLRRDQLQIILLQNFRNQLRPAQKWCDFIGDSNSTSTSNLAAVDPL
jgi:hypothetical protein